MRFVSNTMLDPRRLLLEIYRGMSPGRRCDIALALTDAARDAIRADIAARNPGADSAQRHALFLKCWLGADLARDVLEWMERRKGLAEPGP